ncbi:MAG TPA: hypothetical protein VGN00_02310 [Puia sp.]|jgi:hypothetical protein
MRTNHQFLNLYPIEPDSHKLIVGTIHPPDPSRFKVQFFYGNRGSLWTILHHAFPLELVNPDSVESIRSFLRARKIAMSDTVAVREQKGYTLGENFFGRPVRLVVLHSPAGTANISLSKSKEYLADRHLYDGIKSPVQMFKIDYYRRVFGGDLISYKGKEK